MARRKNLLFEDICAHYYEHTERMIYKICWDFKRKYGGEIDDWIEEAHEIFMDCIKTYNKEHQSQFTTWLYNKLCWGFNSRIRKLARDKTPHTISIEELNSNEDTSVNNILKDTRRDNTLRDIIQQASLPVLELWHLLHYPPPELIDELDIDSPRESWDAIERYCSQALQWPSEKMNNTIEELKELCNE